MHEPYGKIDLMFATTTMYSLIADSIHIVLCFINSLGLSWEVRFIYYAKLYAGSDVVAEMFHKYPIFRIVLDLW